MAVRRRYSPLNVTVPANTAQDAPQVTVWDEGDVWLYGVQLQIPAGNSGMASIGFTLAGAQLIPWSMDPAFITGDNNYFEFDAEVEVGNGLEIVTFNTDVWDHSFYLRFVNLPISMISAPAQSPVVAVF